MSDPSLAATAQGTPRPRMPRAVIALGVVSLLMDLSSEMIHGLLPAFLIGGLGASALALGLIEGAAEATALMVKVVSGVLSDRSGKRKPWTLYGYGLAALAKPLFSFAASAGWIFGARLIDRVGKGLRGAPRDALIADLTPPAIRGAAYGMRQSLDTIGAVAGPLLAMALMVAWHDDVRAVFRVAIVPAALAVFVLWRFVDEAPRTDAAAQATPKTSGGGDGRTSAGSRWAPLAAMLRRLLPFDTAFDGRFAGVVALGAAAMLARISEAFLVLRASEGGLSLRYTPLVLVALNVVYALTAWPLGRLADRIPRHRLLALGMAVLVAADLALAMAPESAAIWLGIALFGLHLGMTQGLLAAMVADAAPATLRGTAFGVFHLVSGAALLLGNGAAGLLWQQLGAEATFIASAGCAGSVAVAALWSSRTAARP